MIARDDVLQVPVWVLKRKSGAIITLFHEELMKYSLVVTNSAHRVPSLRIKRTLVELSQFLCDVDSILLRERLSE